MTASGSAQGVGRTCQEKGRPAIRRVIDMPYGWTRAAALVAAALCAWFLLGDYPGLFGTCDFDAGRDAEIAAWHDRWHVPFVAAVGLAGVCLLGWLRALWLTGPGRLVAVAAAGTVAGFGLTVGVLALAAVSSEFGGPLLAPLVTAGVFAAASRLSARRSNWWEIAAFGLTFAGLYTLAILGEPSPGAFVC
jgi:hypothetical protein